VARDFFCAETQEAHGVCCGRCPASAAAKERRALDDFNRPLDHSWPHHLIRSEHDPLAKAGVDTPKVTIERGARLREPM
jgi:hypothetical protein